MRGLPVLLATEQSQARSLAPKPSACLMITLFVDYLCALLFVTTCIRSSKTLLWRVNKLRALRILLEARACDTVSPGHKTLRLEARAMQKQKAILIGTTTEKKPTPYKYMREHTET